jgi:hypothetical protein
MYFSYSVDDIASAYTTRLLTGPERRRVRAFTIVRINFDFLIFLALSPRGLTRGPPVTIRVAKFSAIARTPRP